MAETCSLINFYLFTEIDVTVDYIVTFVYLYQNDMSHFTILPVIFHQVFLLYIGCLLSKMGRFERILN